MVSSSHSAFLALLLSSAFNVGYTIRTLKDGPMIGPGGREYKSAAVRLDDTENVSQPPSHQESSIQVQCTDTEMIIVIKADLYNNGRSVSPGELSLGRSEREGCQAVAVSDAEYVIAADLRDCGSKLTISDDSVVYSNKLMFSPAARYHGITRMTKAAVPVSCHYKRTHFVSSHAPQPPLTFSTSTKYSAEHSGFSLKLMTDDWRSERFSSIFYLGDVLHLEASYSSPDPVPRRLFMDSCVATLQPDAASVPRYHFIENHGCLTDAKEVGSNALFLPQTRADKLQLQLDAFLFHRDPRNTIYITCQLKATSQMWRSGPNAKACNYLNSRWRHVDGDDEVCGCCESDCSSKWNQRANPRRLIPEGLF
uniref:Zona pellucida sperm-binding protein 3 n=1 Tax=Myripristis murdjan TaxID=586833 RepID=A0A667XDZ1_9TELE